MKRLTFILVLLLALPATAVEPVSHFGKAQPATLADLQPHLFGRESYSESWSHGVWDAQGKFLLGIDFMVTNLGVGDHKGAVSLELVDEKGKHSYCKKEYDDDEWKWSREVFRLDFGKNRLSGDTRRLQLVVECQQYRVELTFDNQLPAAKPGGGKLSFGDEGNYWLVFTSPRSRVSGTVTSAGKTRRVSGIGYADHSRLTIAPYDMARRWFRFKHIVADSSLVMAAMETCEDFGHVLRGWALYVDEAGQSLVTGQVNFAFSDYIRDSKSDAGYSIPRLVRFAAAGAGGQLLGTLRMTGLKEVRDPLARLGAIKRAIVRRYTKPRDYYINANLKLKLLLAGAPPRDVQHPVTFRYYYVNP